MPGTTARSTLDPLSEPVSISTPQPPAFGGPKKTRAPGLIRCPVRVSARSRPSATLLFGVTVESLSGSVFTTNGKVFDTIGTPPGSAGLVTVTMRLPSAATADAGTVTRRRPGVSAVGVSVNVPNPTRAFGANPLPMISRVKALDPALVVDGESEKILRTLHGPINTETELLFELVTTARLLTSPDEGVRPNTSSFSLVTSAQSRPGFTAIAWGRFPMSTERILSTIPVEESLTMWTALRFSSATTS